MSRVPLFQVHKANGAPTRTSRLITWLKSWRRRPAIFAHPWSAYHPKTYLAGNAPPGKVIATRARSLVEHAKAKPVLLAEIKADMAPQSTGEGCTTPANVALLDARALVISQLQSAMSKGRLQPSNRPKTGRSHLTLVSSSKITTDALVAEGADAIPALKGAYGNDFKLAARLRSVETMNRKRPSRHNMRRTTVYRTDRSKHTKHVVKRVSAITTPATRRRPRRSADIVQLELTLARQQLRNSRAHKAA